MNQPIVVAAFEGWNDAGEAASSAMSYLLSRWDAEPFAAIDPENFYDFTTTRPHVRITDDDLRAIDWPENRFSIAHPRRRPRRGAARRHRTTAGWRTFCEHVLDVAERLEARLVLTLGALLADVPHSRPTSVFGTAYDPTVIEALDLEPSSYEGPTGIVGVLHAECRDRGIHSASLWAAVPSYVAAAPSPKAAQRSSTASVRCSAPSSPVTTWSTPARSTSGRSATSSPRIPRPRRTSRHLEETHDLDERRVDSVDELVDEVERFLAEQ